MAIVIIAALLGIWRYRSRDYFKWLAILFVWMLAGTYLFAGGGTLEDPTGDGLIAHQIRIATNDGPGMGLFAILFLIVYWGGAIFFISRMVKVARKQKAENEAALDDPDYIETPDDSGRKAIETLALLAASAAWIYFAFLMPTQQVAAQEAAVETASTDNLPPQIERDVLGAAAEVNATTPKRIDATTMLERASASGRTLTYHYRLEQSSTAEHLRSFMLSKVTPKVCSGPLRAAMKSDGVSYTYSYKAPNLNDPVSLTIDEATCARAET